MPGSTYGGFMLNDFKMVVHKLPRDLDYINLYPLADLHIGSAEFNEPMFKLWVKTVEDDPNGYFVTAGDLLNNGIKSSKTNVYEETMRPFQQKEYFYEAIKHLKDKWLVGVGGNHEYRNAKEVDSDPTYDVMCRLKIEDRYRQNGAFVKIAVGTRTSNQKQVAYGIVITHGASRNKHDKFALSIDGADLFISGHTHDENYEPDAKVKMDMQNEMVSIVPYKKVVCTPFQGYGGYALRGEYLPVAVSEFQVLRLDGKSKKINFFTV